MAEQEVLTIDGGCPLSIEAKVRSGKGPVEGQSGSQRLTENWPRPAQPSASSLDVAGGRSWPPTHARERVLTNLCRALCVGSCARPRIIRIATT